MFIPLCPSLKDYCQDEAVTVIFPIKIKGIYFPIPWPSQHLLCFTAREYPDWPDSFLLMLE